MWHKIYAYDLLFPSFYFPIQLRCPAVRTNIKFYLFLLLPNLLLPILILFLYFLCYLNVSMLVNVLQFYIKLINILKFKFYFPAFFDYAR